MSFIDYYRKQSVNEELDVEARSEFLSAMWRGLNDLTRRFPLVIREKRSEDLWEANENHRCND